MKSPLQKSSGCHSIKGFERSGIGKDHVPSLGERIYLRYNGNLSTGGTARECTDEIHPYNADIAVKAAQIIGLDIAGVDITTEDISYQSAKMVCHN